MGLNEEVEDENKRVNNKFTFKSSDDLLGKAILKAYDGKSFQEFSSAQKSSFMNYQLNIIEVSDVDDEEELRLMFLRLQLGALLNAGEKLNAMTGDMKHLVWELGKHDYFSDLKIQQRRFSKELTCAQIALNFFSMRESSVPIPESFVRTRFDDIQEFFKKYQSFSNKEKSIGKTMKDRLDSAAELLEENKLVIKNRAVGVTAFFYISDLVEQGAGAKQLKLFANFLSTFLNTLNEQVKKGINIDRNFHELLTFQSYVSQAAVEKYALRNRFAFLHEYFEYYTENLKIKGAR